MSDNTSPGCCGCYGCTDGTNCDVCSETWCYRVGRTLMLDFLLIGEVQALVDMCCCVHESTVHGCVPSTKNLCLAEICCVEPKEGYGPPKGVDLFDSCMEKCCKQSPCPAK